MSPPLRLAKPKPRLCSCGRDFPGAGGLCRACGATGRLHVHHRKPGVNDRKLLVTVCAG